MAQPPARPHKSAAAGIKVSRNDKYFSLDSRLDEDQHFPPKNLTPKQKKKTDDEEDEEPKPKDTKTDVKGEPKTVKPLSSMS